MAKKRRNKKINLLILELATKQDIEALKEFSKNTKFKLYSFEDLFAVKYDSKARFHRYWRYLKRIRPSKLPFYIFYVYNRIRYPFKFSMDNVRKIAIEKLSFEQYKEKIEEFNIRGVIIPTEYPFLNNLILFSKRLGVKIIIVNKEHIIPVNSKVYEKWVKEKPFRCDLMCCGGEILANLWKKNLPKAKKNKVKITGVPRFDNYYASKNLSREDLCRRIGLDSEKKIIFFPSFKNWRTDVYFKYKKDINKEMKSADLSFLAESVILNRQDVRPIKNQILKALREIVKKNPNIQVVVKLHPDQQPNKDLASEEELLAFFGNISGYKGVIGKPSGFDGRDIIANCDVVAGYESTMIFEGIMMNKPVIVQRWIKSAEERGEVPLAEESACYGAKNPVNFKKKILEILSNPDDYLKEYEEGRKRLLYKYLYKNDGNASKRVFQEIEKVFQS